ncbi:FkbM family methyltransferase [Sphingomonas crusticola]|uniref:FkbM family methyltransferase n=1 Tax=Sphingomonas crusticola TaxID=1697973 RepID=UPI0013C31D61|nr:FkbM family methyltransferase [Sphingomonas crusticola]
MSLKLFIQRHPLLANVIGGDTGLYRRYRKRKEAVFYTSMARLAQRIDADVSVSLPNYGGSFLTPAESALLVRIARYGDYEPDVLAVLIAHLKPDRDFIDVGANIGLFAVAAASRLTSGRVLAIEPTSGAFNRLQQNIERNKAANIMAIKTAVSDHQGSIEIRQIVGREEYSTIGTMTHPSVVDAGAQVVTERVGMTTVDALVVEHGLRPGLIKVDVEGAELNVFKGSCETLLKWRPVIISEISEKMLSSLGGSRDDLVSFIEQQNYNVYSIEDHVADPRGRDGDIVCIPKD